LDQHAIILLFALVVDFPSQIFNLFKDEAGGWRVFAVMK